MAFRVLFKQQKQRDRRATQRDYSDQDAASSRDGRARRVTRCWERRRAEARRRQQTTGARFRDFTSPRECHFRAPPPASAHQPSRACCGMSRPRSKIRQRNKIVARHTAELGAEPVAVVRITHGNQFARIPPGRARGANRLAESARHTNMSERALSLFFHRMSPRFRTSRVSRQPNQRRRRAERRPGAGERAGRYAARARRASSRGGASWSSRVECKAWPPLSRHARTQMIVSTFHFGITWQLVVFGCRLRGQDRGWRPRVPILSCGNLSDAKTLRWYCP